MIKGILFLKSMEGKEAAAPFATIARTSIKQVVLFIVWDYDG